MLDYLISLLEDANDFSWQAAKASHAVLLCKMEQGEIANYNQTEKIDRVRRAHAQRHVPTSNPMASKKNGSRAIPCQYFNKGICNNQATHENKGVTYKHICSKCYQTGKQFPHAAIECRKSKFQKNE